MAQRLWIVELGLVGASAWLCANLVVVLLTAQSPVSVRLATPSLPALPVPERPALSAEALSRLIGVPVHAPERVTAPVVEVPSSSVRAKLLGTVVSDQPEHSLATLDDLEAQRSVILRLGDSIQGGQVVGIERLRVLVERDGRVEALELGESPTPMSLASLPPSSGPLALSPTTAPAVRALRKDEVDYMLGHLWDDAARVHMTPAVSDGRVNGWRVARLKPESFVGKLGFVAGDVIRRVNGLELSDPAKLLELVSRLQGVSRLEVEFERGGRPSRVEYRIR